MKQSQLRNIFLLVIALGAVVYFSRLINTYVNRSQAAQSTVNVSINPASGKIPEGPITFIFQPEKSADKISGVDAHVTIQGDGQFVAWDTCDTVEGGESSLFTELISDETAGRKSCVVLKKDSELPGAVALKGTIQCNGNDPITVTVDTTKSQVTGPVENQLYAFGGTTSATFNCSDTAPTPPEGTGDISATFDPDSCRGNVGDSCNYELEIAAREGQKRISGYYLKVAYDKDVLKGLDINGPASQTGSVKGLLAQSNATPTPTPPPSLVNPTPGVPGPGSPFCNTTQDCITNLCGGNPACGMTCQNGFCVKPGQQPPQLTPTTPVGQPTPPTGGPAPTAGPVSPTPPQTETCSIVSKRVDDEAGTMELLYTCDNQTANLSTSYTNTLLFEGRADGEGSLKIESIQVVGPDSPTAYTVDSGTAQYTIGEGSGDGNLKLDLTLRLQGITKKPSAADKITCRIGLGDGGLEKTIFKKGEFTFNDKGHARGTIAFNAPAGSGYKILPKCEMHMQKKVCVNNPTEDFPGAYGCDKGQIQLKDGNNSIDFSKVIMLTGDLPPEKQDGISNAFDQSLVRNSIGQKGDKCLGIADVNYDGVCNAVDHSLVIAALSVRWDEQ